MYNLNDTIVAVSSPTSDKRAIIRISGSETIGTCNKIFSRLISRDKVRLATGSIAIDSELKVDAKLYLFPAPHSYTGEDVAEIHIYTNSAVSEALLNNLLDRGLRPAEPGEFTTRAYLNGKMDLAQAEAVNEIIVSSNKYQLAAAERLLAGRLAQTTSEVRQSLIDCLSLIEAGLDFSGEDIEFITRPQVIERLTGIKDQLEHLLSSSISYESVIDLPAVGITGAPNSGKSSLLNTLLGEERSIVSHNQKTTRDVLTGMFTLPHCRCVLFDCAGLVTQPENILDELAQQAAIEALRNSNMVIFCADISKKNWIRDAKIRKLIKSDEIVSVATKCDLLTERALPERLGELSELFAVEFVPISAKSGAGIEQLKEKIDNKLIKKSEIHRPHGVALTARHRKAVTEAIQNVNESVNELKAGNDEITAMMLRAAYEALSDIEQPATAHVDEQILEQIFSRFCIGK